jgi:hypothetical protein
MCSASLRETGRFQRIFTSRPGSSPTATTENAGVDAPLA